MVFTEKKGRGCWKSILSDNAGGDVHTIAGRLGGRRGKRGKAVLILLTHRPAYSGWALEGRAWPRREIQKGVSS